MSTTHTPAPDAAPDPVSLALAELVDTGHLTTDQARAAYAAGRAVPPANRRWDLLGVAIGSGLVAVVVLLLSGEIRDGDDLKWPNFLIALGGSTALLAFALAARRFVADPMRRSDLMSWPLALGSGGMGFLGLELMGDNDAAPYVAGVAVVLLAGGGYWMVRRAAPLVAVIAGLALIHFAALGSLITELDGRHATVWLSGGITLFVVMVTLAGWFLPHRNLTAILAGVVALVGHVGAISTFMFLGFFGGFMASGFGEELAGPDPFSTYDEGFEMGLHGDICEGDPECEAEMLDEAEEYCLEFAEDEGMTQEECVLEESCFDAPTCMGMTEEECLADDACMTTEEMEASFEEEFDEEKWDEEEWDDETYAEGEDDYMAAMGFGERDLWGVLGFGLLLLGIWGLCHRLTGHVGYRVLTLVSLTLMVPTATALVIEDGSVTWAGVPAAVGLGILALVGFRALRTGRSQEPRSPEPSVAPPAA